MIVPEVMYSLFTNTCPRCHKGKVFESKNPYSYKKGLKMNESCSCCKLQYEREPGFFFGAMYVSYALTSGLFIVLFLADALWFHLETWVLLTLIISAIIVLFPVTFRWGRLIWMNFFTRYNRHIDTHCDPVGKLS